MVRTEKGNRLRWRRAQAASGRAITIADIARRPASIRRRCRGRCAASAARCQATRQRIERVAGELGYLPNAVAASLRTKQSKLVGVLVPDLGNPLFGPLVTGIEVELRGRGFMCLVAHTTDAPAARSDLVAALAHRQVSGLLILAAEIGDALLDTVQRYRLPTELVNRGFGDRRFSSVVNDDQESVRLVLDHLVALDTGGSRTSRPGRLVDRARPARGLRGPLPQALLAAQVVQARPQPARRACRRRPGCSTDRSPRPRSSRRTT
jgi:hypothetical protein